MQDRMLQQRPVCTHSEAAQQQGTSSRVAHVGHAGCDGSLIVSCNLTGILCSIGYMRLNLQYTWGVACCKHWQLNSSALRHVGCPSNQMAEEACWGVWASLATMTRLPRTPCCRASTYPDSPRGNRGFVHKPLRPDRCDHRFCCLVRHLICLIHPARNLSPTVRKIFHWRNIGSTSGCKDHTCTTADTQKCLVSLK